MPKPPSIPIAVRAQALLELRRRRALAESAEVVGRVVVMPAQDALPVPPESDVALDGAEELVAARRDRLTEMMAKWKATQASGVTRA